MRTLKRTKIKYQTPMTKSSGIYLNKTARTTVDKTYCIAFDVETGKRLPLYDNFYSNLRLEPFIPQLKAA